MFILLSSRALIAGLPDKVKEATRQMLTIDNPLFFKRMDMGLSNWSTPSNLIYFKEDGDVLDIPIGALPRVLELCKSYGILPDEIEIKDNRVSNVQKEYFDNLEFTGTLRDYQSEIVKTCMSKTVGIIEAMTGCHAKGTKILMYSGDYKNVECVEMNDKIMGWDSTPRTVLKLCQGIDQMYKIVPKNGTSFIINENHYLTLKHSVTKTIIDIQVKEFLKLKPVSRSLYKLFRVGVDFETKKSLPIDPYFLGVLLGDGSIINRINITTSDNEIKKVINQQAKKFNNKIRVQQGNGCETLFFTYNKKHNNPIKIILKNLNLYGTDSSTKFIPTEFKLASKENRLQLLAGLLDTDGSYHRGYFDYISKSEQLANDVVFLSRSLGLRSKVISTKKYSQTGKGGIYFRVSICGHVEEIPCKLNRKQAVNLKPNKDQLVTGFNIEKLNKDEYYGFIIDGDHRYLFEDFYVTHNSGKTITFVALTLERKEPTLILVHTIELANQTVNAFAKFTNLKVEDIGFIGDGRWDVKPITVALHQTMAKLDSKRFDLINERFGQVIADEVHIVGAETYYNTMTHLSAKYKFGFSATPKRDDGLTDVIHFATGPKIYTVATELLEDVLVKPNVIRVDTTYHFPIFSSDEYQTLITDLSEDIDRNQLIVDTSNLPEYKDKTMCFLCVRISQVEALKNLIGKDAEILTSKMTKKQRKLVMEKLLDGRCKKIISTYALFSTGIDVPSLDLALLCAPLQAEVKLKQTAGRLMRKAPGKTSATMIDFVDTKVSLLKHQFYKRNGIYKKLWLEK